MRELSLFTGAGGGVLASKLLGHRIVGYVEWENYCQQVIRQRIEDGILDDAPIYGDIEAFLDQGYAERYRGVADVISAGFPCQDISVACKGADGMEGDRSGAGWGATARVIRAVLPQYVFLENSPAILVRGFERVAADLANMGYSFRWGVLGFADIGGIHRRRRWWCLATYADSDRLEGWHDLITKREVQARSIQTLRESKIRMDIPDTGTFRTDYDVANRMDRLKAVGNGQVPRVAATAWRILND